MSQLQYAFRITHIDNIPDVLVHGICRPNSPNANPCYIPIGEQPLIETRQTLPIPGTDKTIGDFTPFYFGPRQPMLYSIQHGYSDTIRREAGEIVYCVVRLRALLDGHYTGWFTDGHARAATTRFFPLEQIGEADQLVRYEDVFRQQWGSDADPTGEWRRLKQAELLIAEDVAQHDVAGFVVGGKSARDRLISFGTAPERVVCRPDYYF